MSAGGKIWKYLMRILVLDQKQCQRLPLLRNAIPSLPRKIILMSFNWLNSYDAYPVLSGRWGYHEDTIATHVKSCTKQIQNLKHKKIVFGGWDPEEKFPFTVDCVHFKINEPRTDPGKKWYSHKSNSAGLTYEFALATRRDQLVWIRGDIEPASTNDISVFR